MVAIKTLLGAAVATFAACADAERLFYNSGNLDGWNYIRKEHQGTVDKVTNVAYKGDSAIKVTQTFDPNYHDRYHSEVDHNDGYKRGQTRSYGFMVRLSDKWDFTSQGYNLAQFISYRTGANCGDDWMPSTMIWINGNKLSTRVVNGVYRGNDCKRNIPTYSNIGTLQAGKWHKIIVQAKWANDNSGWIKMWLDGNKILDKSGLATTVSGDETFQFRVGLYANSWHDQGNKLEGSQGFRQVWYDEISVGTSYDDVDPDKQ